MPYTQKCTELLCQKEIAVPDENARCAECGFPYCDEHLANHSCDGLLLAVDIDLLEEWDG